MRRFITPALVVIVAMLILPLVGLNLAVGGVEARVVAERCEIRPRVNGVLGAWRTVDPAKYPEFCGSPAPTATATSTSTPVPPPATVAPTATAHAHPTATPGTPPASGWHAPTTHEHGDAPPAWVLSSGHAPFTQTRESHTGYKGAYAVTANGVESYFIAHIVETVAARSHGDHDYQLWLKDPSGGISYWAGMLDFGSPPPLRTSDTGERPIILSVGDGGCSTWYSRPGAAIVDVGWTICGRYENFAGEVLGGVGTFRTVDWIIPAERLGAFPGAAPTLAQYCQTEYGICRFGFIVNSKDYGAPGIVPVN